jgi:hypothetical protein
MRELFIYYRVRNADAGAACNAVMAMHDALRSSHAGLRARLLIRREDDVQTWMETYSSAAGSPGIDAALEALIEAHAKGLAPFIDGARHVEAFNATTSP